MMPCRCVHPEVVDGCYKNTHSNVTLEVAGLDRMQEGDSGGANKQTAIARRG